MGDPRAIVLPGEHGGWPPGRAAPDVAATAYAARRAGKERRVAVPMTTWVICTPVPRSS
jgi:hypothetical protein